MLFSDLLFVPTGQKKKKKKPIVEEHNELVHVLCGTELTHHTQLINKQILHIVQQHIFSHEPLFPLDSVMVYDPKGRRISDRAETINLIVWRFVAL